MTRRLFLSVPLSLAALPALAASKVVEDARKKVKEGKFDEAITSLEAERKKNPKNDELKSALAETHFAYGEHLMYNKELPPFQKYPSALKNFRKTVEHDPSNRKASDHINSIEGIYRSMGRPIPK